MQRILVMLPSAVLCILAFRSNAAWCHCFDLSCLVLTNRAGWDHMAGQWVSPPSCYCDGHSQPCLLLLHEDGCFRAATYRHCFVSSSPSVLLKSPSAHFMLFQFIPQLLCRYNLTAVGKRRGVQYLKWISVRGRSVGRSVTVNHESRLWPCYVLPICSF
jgi:hypothetical protein